MKMLFNSFTLKAFFVLKIFILIFWSYKNWLDQKDKVNFKIYHVRVNKRLQYKYCPIFHKVKGIRQ